MPPDGGNTGLSGGLGQGRGRSSGLGAAPAPSLDSAHGGPWLSCCFCLPLVLPPAPVPSALSSCPASLRFSSAEFCSSHRPQLARARRVLACVWPGLAGTVTCWVQQLTPAALGEESHSCRLRGGGGGRWLELGSCSSPQQLALPVAVAGLKPHGQRDTGHIPAGQSLEEASSFTLGSGVHVPAGLCRVGSTCPWAFVGDKKAAAGPCFLSRV